MEESNISPSDEVSSPLFDLPPTARARLKGGFSVLATISPDNLGDLVEATKKSLGVQQPLFEKYASTFNVSLENVVGLISATVMTASFLATRPISAEKFAQAAVEEQLAKEEDKAAVAQFAQLVLDQVDSVKDTLDRLHLAARILPLFTSLDTTVDVRLRFNEGQVQTAVPVAILWFSTDKDEEEIVFQTTQEGIEQIIEQLEEIQRRLQTTEEWTTRQQAFHKGE